MRLELGNYNSQILHSLIVSMEKKLSDTERLKLSKARKIEEKRKANREKYYRNKDKINEARKRKRQLARESKTKAVDTETKIRREKWKLAKQKQRTKQKPSNKSEVTSGKPFSSRQAKRRKLTEVKSVMPKTPTKRAAIYKALIESPSTRNLLEDQGILTSPEESEEAAVAVAALRDAREALKDTKRKRSDDARAATQTSLAFLCGKNVEKGKMKGKIAKRLNINRKRIVNANAHRAKVLSSEESCWTLTKRHTRSDAISEKDRKLAHDFWASPLVSRVSPHKTDAEIRKRLAPKTYVKHARHLLEKTQTEAYLDFKEKYPEVKMGQRAFEKCKPFFVTPPRMKDRITCCCRSHVEARMMFKSCMDFRRSVSGRLDNYVIYEHLSHMVNDTLCPKEDNELFHRKECLIRKCSDCGVSKLNIMEEEKNTSNEAPVVKWRKFEYVSLGTTEDGQQKKRLQLVDKSTNPGEMFTYLLSLLQSYPSHQFRANWQNQQFKALVDNLPLGHACAVHDYSENYACVLQHQLQSLYFSQTQVSIHITVLHRHAMIEIDGEQSTQENPVVITEHLFTISPDTKHDHHSVHCARELMDDYLKKIGELRFLCCSQLSLLSFNHLGVKADANK